MMLTLVHKINQKLNFYFISQFNLGKYHFLKYNKEREAMFCEEAEHT